MILDHNQHAWLPIGGAIGIGILVKYSILILPSFNAGLSHFLEIGFFCSLRSPYPYLGIVIALLISHQHIIWLIGNNFITLTYLSDRGATASGHAAAAIAAAKFVLAQLADHLPLMIVLGLCGVLKPLRWAVPQSVKPRFDLLLLFGLGPCLIAMVVTIIAGISLRDMWGAPMWSLSGIMVTVLLGDILDRRKTTIVLRSFFVMFMVIVQLICCCQSIWQQGDRKTTADRLASHHNSGAFRQRVGERKRGCPLTIVAGENWLAGLISAKAAPPVCLDKW